MLYTREGNLHQPYTKEGLCLYSQTTSLSGLSSQVNIKGVAPSFHHLSRFRGLLTSTYVLQHRNLEVFSIHFVLNDYLHLFTIILLVNTYERLLEFKTSIKQPVGICFPSIGTNWYISSGT